MFNYNKMRFIPYRKFKNTESDIIEKKIISSNLFDSTKPYNYDSFYESANCEDDIFLCLDNLKLFTPATNQFFEVRPSDLIEDEENFKEFLEIHEAEIDYHSLLIQKIDSEYKTYVEALLEMSPKEIYDSTFETHMKKEFLFHIKTTNLLKKNKTLCKVLFNKENALDFIFNYWISKSKIVFSEDYDETLRRALMYRTRRNKL